MAKIIKLTESDLRRIVKKVIKEQSVLGTLGNAMEISSELLNTVVQTIPAVSLANMAASAIKGDAKSFNQIIDQEQARLGNTYTSLKNAVTKGDIAKNLQNIGGALQPYAKQMKSGFGNQVSKGATQAATPKSATQAAPKSATQAAPKNPNTTTGGAQKPPTPGKQPEYAVVDGKRYYSRGAVR